MHGLTWQILTLIGTIAFAASGAIVAMKEKYDILGVLVLGFVTAFGGGIVRNVLIGLPVTSVWHQPLILYSAFSIAVIAFLLPKVWFKYPKMWIVLDAIGLSAFTIQGAYLATEANMPFIAVVFSALLTGTGGGVIRDVLARRRPLLFRDEIYGGWAIIGATIFYFYSHSSSLFIYGLLIIIVALRLTSYRFRWVLPRRT